MIVFLLLAALQLVQTTAPITKDYIVYLGNTRGREPDVITKEHHELLKTVAGSSEGIIYSYRHGFSGFAAKLTEEQANTLSVNPEVVQLGVSRLLQVSTTRSWDFLRSIASSTPLYPEQASETTAASDVIIGLLDTGIWPESESFQETPYIGPVPSRWKGACVNGDEDVSDAIICNRKLIGARYYTAGADLSSDYINARDSHGHGTHTSSTAAGNAVANVSMEGLAPGTARGGLATARIACYKICWSNGCPEMGIAAAIDDAIHDGVDVLSISVGGPPDRDFVSLLSFHAVEKGVSVVASAGNDGPRASTVSNIAPWLFTVGASTIDRNISEGVTIIPYKPAPVAADFSSRGPNSVYLDIIKPDVTAPGVQILAAWPSSIPNPYDYSETVNYTFQSGTSMACPHVSGAIAFLKVVHPTWSASALKSALMTSARFLDNMNQPIQDWNGEPADFFTIGSGLIQPNKAIDPGLVYDAEPEDFVLYLCSSGFTTQQMQGITGSSSYHCPLFQNSSGFTLNYPSIALNGLVGVQTISRIVTNVGPSNSIYEVVVTPVQGLSIVVEPKTLVFSKTGEKKRYEVMLSSNSSASRQDNVWLFATITWSDGMRVVRTPLAVSV